MKKKCLIRERIDIEGSDPKMSYLHKVYDDGETLFYSITGDASSKAADISEAEWLELLKTHEPQATYPNSEWGDGMPGAGAKWATIPADRRGEEPVAG